MMRYESSPRCPKCGCANNHNCGYERCIACVRGSRSRAAGRDETTGSATPLRLSLTEEFLAAA